MKKEFDNEERRGYYGLRKGDIVSLFMGVGVARPKAVVVEYGVMDNNRVYVRGEYGVVTDEVAEWCEIVTKVEDKRFQNDETVITPDGKAVVTLVDNVDKAVRVKHLEAKTPVIDYFFKDLIK